MVINYRDWITYDPDRGIFRWLNTSSNRAPKGSIAGSLTRTGYTQIKIRGHWFAAHRLAWWFEHGEMPALGIDHINGIKTDNRIANLRLATTAQNVCNRGPQRNNSSGYKGVSFSKREGIWISYITVQQKRIHLGSFKTKEEAVAIRLSVEEKYQREFAWLGHCRA